MQSTTTADLSFVAGAGEMAARMRAFPWAETPLGELPRWPQPLRTLVALMLASRQPMFITWGAERTWLYNDAFIPVLGAKHPGALGRPALADVWSEARDTLAPMFDRVFAGEAVEMPNFSLLLDRRGRLEEAHFAFCYTPARDESGAVAGLFGACIEITAQVRAEQARVAAEERRRAVHESEMRFREIADAAPVLIWISDGSKACVWFNRPWLDFTGRTLEQEVGEGWMHDVHPDDLARCVATYHAAFERRERYHSEYRLRRADGEWRIVEDTGVPRFSATGTFLGYVGSCVDVTEQHAAGQALRASEEQLRLATEAAEIGLWDVDLVTDTLFWPPRVKAMFGISPDVQVSMDDFYAGLHPEDRKETSAAFAAAIDPARRALYDVEYRTVGKEDGIVRWVAAKGRGVFAADGRCVRVIGTAIDITARRQAEAALRESDRRKDEFIATLSHELRNPLAPLSNALQILRLSDDAAERERVRAMMERQVNHLVRLVDDLLEVSRISHGALELRREPVELAAIVRNATEASAPLLCEAGHTLDVTLPAEPVWLEGDPVRLAQILANLLNNAARYMAPGGHVGIAGSVVGDVVVVSVKDRGVGFAPDAVPRLFEMFARGENSAGLGIGLALARRLAEMHGGSLDAASEGPGKGAQFTLRLPRAEAPADRGDGIDGTLAAPRRQRILVVDDNEDAADSTRMMLELLGADVRAAHCGREAIATFDAWQPDVELLDLGMPDMDGYAVARALRATTRGDETLVVALSGWGQERDRQRTREAGFDHHLVKPVDFRTLSQLLDEMHASREPRHARLPSST
jgi:PAS domain S-box-containing protein